MSASGVSVHDVRMELGDTTGVIDESLIQYHLGRAEGEILAEAPETTTATQLEAAIAVAAAYRVAVANTETFIENWEELDVREQYDVETYISALKDRRDDELASATDEGRTQVVSLGSRGHPP